MQGTDDSACGPSGTRSETVLHKMLAANTNYAAMISGPQYHRNKLKFIQLSQMDEHKLLVVVVVEGNLVKNTDVGCAECDQSGRTAESEHSPEQQH